MDASELKEILDQHKLWVETNGMQGERANLRCANLRCANLGGANLGGANLSDADLTGASLRGASLRVANLTRANLTRANLTRANLTCAILENANLQGANLEGADLEEADLTGAKDLPDISWIIPGCLVQLNQISYGFYLAKEDKYENFVQDSFGFFIQNNPEEDTFDMLLGDRIIRSIPNWVKYSGMKQVATESV